MVAIAAAAAAGGGGGGGGGGGPGGGGPMGDFSLVLMKLAKPGVQVKTGDIVAEFDPQNQLQRLDDYKDTAVQQENMVKKMLANLAAVKEAHDQQVRSAKADWDKAVLDLKTADVRSRDRCREVQADGGGERSQVQAAGGGVGAGGRIAARADPRPTN